jgi:hypothetical protein
MIEEEALFVGVSLVDAEIVLDRVRIEEMLRCLNQPDCRIMEEGKGARNKVDVRNEIGVED